MEELLPLRGEVARRAEKTKIRETFAMQFRLREIETPPPPSHLPNSVNCGTLPRPSKRKMKEREKEEWMAVMMMPKANFEEEG